MSLHFLHFVKMNSTRVYTVFETFQREIGVKSGVTVEGERGGRLFVADIHKI
jgi:hypothetical protein